MNDTAPPPADDQGLMARAIGVVVSPGATLKGVVRNPRPAGILLLSCLVIGLATSLPQFTERGQEQLLEVQVRQTEQFTGQPVSDQQYAGMRAFARYSPYITLVSIVLFAPMGALLFTAVYWFVFNAILGGTATFKQVLGLVTHSQVIGALAAIAALPIIFAQGPTNSMGPFHLGVLVPMLDADGFVARFLGWINVFLVWQLIVNAIGLGLLYRRRTANIAIGLITAYVLLAAGIAAAVTAVTS